MIYNPVYTLMLRGFHITTGEHEDEDFIWQNRSQMIQ